MERNGHRHILADKNGSSCAYYHNAEKAIAFKRSMCYNELEKKQRNLQGRVIFIDYDSV